MRLATFPKSNVIPAASRFREPVPVLVLLDLQRQHMAGDQRLQIPDAAPVASACRSLLDAARQAGVPVAHARRVEAAPVFNPASELTGWLDECRPLPHEMIYEHALPSCYAADGFARFFDYVEDPFLVLAGFGTNYTGLATAIDGFARGHRIWFVPEACGSYDGGFGISRDATCRLLAQFAEARSLGSVLSAFRGETRRGAF